jgi:hypothetical protein
MASNALALAAASAKITNVGELRAAMGAVSQTLGQGYPYLDSISWIAGEKDAARSLLDTVNTSAQMLYAIVAGATPDLWDQDISTSHAILAGQVVSQANDALKLVEAAAAQNLWDIASIVSDAIDQIRAVMASAGAAVGTTLQGLVNAAGAGAASFAFAAWPTLLIVGALGVAYLYRGKIARALVGAA